MISRRVQAATDFLLLCGQLLGATAHAEGSIHGFVYAQGTTQGLPNASVEIDIACVRNGRPQTCQYFRGSAADGSFSVSSIEAGTATLFVIAEEGNYLPASETVIVTDDQDTQITIFLVPGAAISGNVSRQVGGEGIAGIQIQLLDASDLSAVYGTATTSADGNFRIERIIAGTYAVGTLGAAPYQDQFYAGRSLVPPSQGVQLADSVSVTTGQSVSDINFALREGGRIRGTLTDRYTGLPIANVTASSDHSSNDFEFIAYDSAAPNAGAWLHFYASTDSQGRYEIAGLPDEPVYVGAHNPLPVYLEAKYGCSLDSCNDFSSAIALSAPSGTTLENIDFSLFPGSVIRGTVSVRAGGAPVQGATITAFYYTTFGPLAFATTVTDALGQFVFAGNVSNTYLEVSNASTSQTSLISQDYNDHNCQQGACNTRQGDLVSVDKYQVKTGIDFHLDPGAVIRGQVLSKSDGQGISARVTLVGADGTVLAFTATDVNGSFATTALQAGSYYLRADNGDDCQLYPGVACATDGSVTAGQAIVISGTQDVTGISLALLPDAVFANGFE
jgi:hypothetical protein